MAEALRSALEPRARKLKKLLRGAAHGRPESIHDARTTIRRLRNGLVVMGQTVYEPSYVGFLENDLHEVEKSLAATRDDDVLLDSLRQWARRAPRGLRGGVAPLTKRLRRRRRSHARVLAKKLHRRRTRRVVKELRRFVCGRPRATPGPPRNPAHAVPEFVRHFVADQIWRSYEEVLAYDTRVPTSNIDVIHKVRSACRQLRYRLELFESALPCGTTDVIASLRALQERLGSLHDHFVAVETLERWLSSGRLPRSEAIEDYVHRQRRARDRLRAEFDKEWRSLTSHAFRHVIARVAASELRSRPTLRLVPDGPTTS